jgi:WD40 repeat protein
MNRATKSHDCIDMLLRTPLTLAGNVGQFSSVLFIGSASIRKLGNFAMSATRDSNPQQNPIDATRPTLNGTPPGAPAGQTDIPALNSAAPLAPLPTTATPRTAAAIPGYAVLRELSSSNSGASYKARHLGRKRLDVVKLLAPASATFDQDLAQCRKEAKALAELQNPNIALIHEVGSHQGRIFIAREFIAGRSVAEEWPGVPAAPAEAARLVATVAHALHAAHEAGIVHGHLKLTNIILAAGSGWREAGEEGSSFTSTPKVSDLGLAGGHAPEAEVGFLAPEANAKTARPAADVYALGAILFELLTGRPPGPAPTSLQDPKRAQEPPGSGRRLQPKVPRKLEALCLQCLSADPAARPRSALTLAEELERFVADPGSRRRHGPGQGRLLSRLRPKSIVGWIAAVVVVLLLLAMLTGLVFRDRLPAGFNEVVGRLFARAPDPAFARRAAYLADMRAVSQAWQESRLDVGLQLLKLHQPSSADEEDLRGFEWYYLWRLYHSELFDLQGHSGINGLAFTPDGRRLATAGQEGVVKVWDAHTGKELMSLSAKGRAVASVAVSPDGRFLAAAGDAQDIFVWDIISGNIVKTLAGSNQGYLGLAFAADSRRLAVLGRDGIVQNWDCRTGAAINAFGGQPREVVRSAFSADGSRLAVASAEGLVTIWDVDKGVKVRALKAHALPATALAFSLDGRRLAAANQESSVRIWDASSGREKLTIPRRVLPQAVTALAFRPDSDELAVGFADGSVRSAETFLGTEVRERELRGHTGPITCLAFSPNGWRLASAGQDASVKIRDAAVNQLALEMRATNRPASGGPAFNPVSAAVAFSPDGKYLAAGGANNTVAIIEAATGQLAFAWSGHSGPVIGVAFSSDGRHLASASEDGTVRLWDMADHSAGLSLGIASSAVTTVAFSPDDTRLASGGRDARVHIRDVQTGEELLILSGHASSVTGVAFSPDGERLASTSLDKTVIIWDATTGREIFTLTGHTGPVLSVAFSPDGRLLATGSQDGTIMTWDVATGRKARTMRLTLTAYMNSVAFSPDGERLASASSDGFVRIWDVATGLEALANQGHNNQATGVAFSPDGTRLASVAHLSPGKIWEAAPPTSDVRRHQEAYRLVAYLYLQLGRPVLVRDQLQRDSALDPVDRADALGRVDRYQPDANSLNQASWVAIREPGADPAAARRAVAQAAVAVELSPGDGNILNTLGVAQYRSGLYREAVATLTQSDQLNTKVRGGPIPEDLAFLAMAHFQLGHMREAEVVRARYNLVKLRPQVPKEGDGFQQEVDKLFRSGSLQPTSAKP